MDIKTWMILDDIPLNLGGQILISEATRQELGPILRMAEQIEIEAKGIDQPTTVHDVRGIGGAYNLFLPDREEGLVPLRETIPLRYTVLEGKHLGEAAFTGRLVKLSAKGAEVYADHPMALRSDIKIQLTGGNGEPLPGDLYAKVQRHVAENHPGFYVHFTSISPEIAASLQGMLASCSPGN